MKFCYLCDCLFFHGKCNTCGKNRNTLKFLGDHRLYTKDRPHRRFTVVLPTELLIHILKRQFDSIYVEQYSSQKQPYLEDRVLCQGHQLKLGAIGVWSV